MDLSTLTGTQWFMAAMLVVVWYGCSRRFLAAYEERVDHHARIYEVLFVILCWPAVFLLALAVEVYRMPVRWTGDSHD